MICLKINYKAQMCCCITNSGVGDFGGLTELDIGIS